MDKTERIKQIEETLLSNNRGWSRSELGRKFGVDRSTIKRDVDYIQEKGLFPISLKDNKVYLESDGYLSNIQMNMHEMLALHLATRLLVKKSSFASRHYASLLRKISQSYANHSRLISRYMGDTADGLDEQELTREQNRRNDRLELMNRAWTGQHKVKITYRSPRGRKSYTLGIYCFEPYAEGLSLHVVGLCDGETRARNFKFERIESVAILREEYEIPDVPDEFRPHEYYRDAWGIWTTGEEPVTVKLKFDPSVAERVKETRWHVSEEVEEQDDGSLIWTGRVAEPIEMLPWIRGWGSMVTVLEPSNLL